MSCHICQDPNTTHKCKDCYLSYCEKCGYELDFKCGCKPLNIKPIEIRSKKSTIRVGLKESLPLVKKNHKT